MAPDINHSSDVGEVFVSEVILYLLVGKEPFGHHINPHNKHSMVYNRGFSKT